MVLNPFAVSIRYYCPPAPSGLHQPAWSSSGCWRMSPCSYCHCTVLKRMQLT